MRAIAALLICALVLGPGCKTVDDYLLDLENVDPITRDSFDLDDSSILFDEGQLGHEALAGLAVAEELQFWQAMRALYQAVKMLGRARDNALLQSDAAVLIGHIVIRLPVPPIGEKLVVSEERTALVQKHFLELLDAREPLKIDGYIAALDSPDEVVKQEALEGLRTTSGLDLGRDAGAWRSWFDGVRDERVAEFVEESREPLRALGALQYKNASEARGVLGALSLWLKLYAHPDLVDVYVPATLSVARQASVHALASAIVVAKDVQVRCDVADAIAKIRDVEFGEPLANRLQRERDPKAASKIIRALRFYPGRQTIERVIDAMALESPQVLVNAAQTLEAITGRNHGEDRLAWAEWWRREGDAIWP